jgi:hypothetical protein
VTNYENGSYLQWNGWVPFFHFLCVGMPTRLITIEEPKITTIDLNKEEESLHHHQRNKLIGRGLMLLTMALIGYLLRNKIYNAGSLLLQ